VWLTAIALASWLMVVPRFALASPAPLVWASPVSIDDQPPYAYPTEVSGVSCPSRSLCVAVDNVGDVLVSTNPSGSAKAWVRNRVAENLNAISCPSSGFCVAVGDGVIAVSSDPAGGAPAWSTARIGSDGPLLKYVSCASASLCVATEGDSGPGEVWSSSNPSGGAGAWSEVKAEGEEGVGGVSCPTSKLCVAVGSGYGDNVFTSTDPTGGASAWTTTKIDSAKPNSQRLSDVSCASESLCVATDEEGDVLTSTEPTGGAGAWSSAKVGGLLQAVSCASWGFCVALNRGEAITSADPTGGPSAWRATPIENGPSLEGASCPAANLCVLVGSDSEVVTATEPTGGSSAWSVTPVEVGYSDLRGVSCASVDLCVWVDDAGNIVTSTDPTGGAAAWVESHIDDHQLDSVSCIPGLCVAVDNAGDVLASTDPAGGVGAWSIANVDGSIPLEDVSCASVSLCVAIDREGNVVASNDPTGGASAWHVAPVSDSRLGGVACPSEYECAVTDEDEVITSIDPAEGGWVAKPETSTSLGAISCPTVNGCVAVSSGAEDILAWGAPIVHGFSRWSEESFELNPLDGISCAAGGGLCMATSVGGEGADGDVIYSYEPAGGAETWGKSNVYGVPFEPPGGQLNLFEDDINGVACVAQGMCIVGDGQRRVMVAVPQYATAPTNTSTPELSGSATVGEPLSCAPGAWTGEPAPILTEQWLRNGTPILGATAGTYVVQASDEGDTITCEVTAANGAGRKSTLSNTLHIQTAPRPGNGGSGGGSSGGGSSVGDGSSNGGGGSQGGVTGTASNAFTLDGMEIIAAHGTIKLTLTLPAPGILQFASKTTSSQLASHERKIKTLLVARVRLTVSKAGRISVTLAPTGEAKRMLSRQGKLKATLTITYTPTGGTARSVDRTVTFRMRRNGRN
jgi:hypothetical protein